MSSRGALPAADEPFDAFASDTAGGDGERDDARVRLYEQSAEPFSQLRSWVEEVEAFWDARHGHEVVQFIGEFDRWWGDLLASLQLHAQR